MNRLQKAIAYAVNYHSVDNELNMPDFKIAEMLEPQVQEHLDGRSSVQQFEHEGHSD